jgi:hypothetical protein
MIKNLTTIDYQDVIDWDADYYCQGCSGCEHGDDYCRGAMYDNFSIKPFSLGRLGLLASAILDTDDSRYTLALMKSLQSDPQLLDMLNDRWSWEYEADWGYYGQEMDRICITNNDLVIRLEAHASSLPTDPDGAVDECMLAEYGRLLPCMGHYEVRHMSLSLIRSSLAKPYPERVREYASDPYLWVAKYNHTSAKTINEVVVTSGELPVAVVKPEYNGWHRIIDGNHRYHAIKSLTPRYRLGGDPVVTVIVANPL